MKPKITPSQRTAVDEWIRRTVPGRSYSISEVFPARDCIDNGHRRAMDRLRTLGLLRPGIPGGNPLHETS